MAQVTRALWLVGEISVQKLWEEICLRTASLHSKYLVFLYILFSIPDDALKL